MKQARINAYNTKGNLLIITNYPPRGAGIHTAKIGGVSGFAKNTLIPLAEKLKGDGRKIIVFADIIRKPEVYEEDGMLVVRAWKRDTLFLYWQLIRWFIRFWRVGNVFVEFEFASYGDFVMTSLFPAFLLLLRLSGKRVTVALHQVVTDLWSISGHLGFRFDSREFTVFSALLPAYYAILTHISHQTVVLEEEFKKRLAHLAPVDRVTVIPHGIEQADRIPTKKRARRLLGLNPNEYIVTSLGFITWYKGTDNLMRLLENPVKVNGRPVRLLIAGGPSTTQEGKDHYQKYLSSVADMARGKKHITITGFMPDKKIPLYLAASDLLVFPYRAAMSSSGPLSLAFAYKKPILLSQPLATVLGTADYKMALKEAGLRPRTILLPENTAGFVARLGHIGKRSYKKRMNKFLRLMQEKRSFTSLASSYDTLLAPKESPATVFNPLAAFQ